MSVLEIGTTIAGRYLVERELAKGGFGAVYIAQHRVTEERVALKVLWPHVLKSKDAVDRFQLEATIAAKVGSEHIVRVLDAGFDEALKMPFLVMELLKGKTLEQMVESEGPLAPLEAMGVLAQTASALGKAHTYRDAQGNARPIIHRDLKPENLFFARRESGEPCVKILDFGIAKVLSETSHVSREVKGTPLYMSHEQMLGSGVGPATDIWALGLIAFYLMTGKTYWLAGNNREADMNALFAEVLHLPTDLASARAHRLGIKPPWPGAFDGWLARCLEREPSRRFTSVGEALEALNVALGTPDSRPDSPALARARTMLGERNHLDQSIPEIATKASAEHLPAIEIVAPFPSPLVVASLGAASRGAAVAQSAAVSHELPAVSQTRGPSLGVEVSASGRTTASHLPLLYGALGAAAAAIFALCLALFRPWASPAGPVPGSAPSVVRAEPSSATLPASPLNGPALAPVATASGGASATAAISVGKLPPRAGAPASAKVPGTAPTKDPFDDR